MAYGLYLQDLMIPLLHAGDCLSFTFRTHRSNLSLLRIFFKLFFTLLRARLLLLLLYDDGIC